MKENRDKLYLLHVRDAIEKVELYSSGKKFDDFSKDEQSFDAIMMQFIVIGESVNNLSDEFKDSHHDLSWHEAVGLRNQTAHGYFDIDKSIVWQTIKEDLPVLKKEIMGILNKL